MPEAEGSAIRARLDGGVQPLVDDEARGDASILAVAQRLKARIRAKDREISSRTNELVATRDYLKSVFGALADAVLVIDRSGRLEFANQAALDLLDDPDGRLLGAEAGRLLADPAERAAFRTELDELLRLRTFVRTEVDLRTARGRVLPVTWSSAVLEVEGRAAGLAVIARDRRIEHRLEEARLRAVKTLTASVAHEIRNPLGAILNSVALLRRDAPLEGDDARLLEIVHGETERIDGIVRQFLEFARPAPPASSPGDVGPLLEDVATLARRDERAAGKELLLRIEPALPPVAFDAGQVKQVVWNLVSNALDAARSRVAVRARPAPGGAVEVRVADDGPGIRPDLLARACEPFRTTKAQGTGLGLAISKRIVEAHGGALRLGSVSGGGTTASFTLSPAPEAP